MKYLRAYENKETDLIKIISINDFENYIIVNKEELEVLQEEGFTILWNDGIIEDAPECWMFENVEENDIRNWLKLYRKFKDPKKVNKLRNYNLSFNESKYEKILDVIELKSNEKKPEIGDYVLIKTCFTNVLQNFINKTPGIIQNIQEDRVDHWGNVTIGDIIVEYENVPDYIKSWFRVVVLSGEYSDSKYAKYFRNFDQSQIFALGKTLEELKKNITFNKFRL